MKESHAHRHRKKVISKPYGAPGATLDIHLSTMAQAYHYKKEELA